MFITPEFCLTGYPPGDLLFREDFIEKVNLYKNRIINEKTTKKYFACLINNIGSKFQVEFYGRSINKVEKPSWYVFPWEIESQQA